MAKRGPTVFLVLAALAGLAAFLIVRNQLGAVVLALALGYLLQPVYQWLLPKVRKPWAATSIVMLLVFVVLLGPFVLLVILFVGDAQRFLATLESREDVRSSLADFLESLGLPDGSVDAMAIRILEGGATYLQEAAVPIATFAVEFVIALVVFLILLFYVIRDGPKLASYLKEVLPAPNADVGRMLEKVGDRIKAIALGTVLVAIIQAALAGLGWWVLDLPAPVFWAFVMLVVELVPMVGSFVVLLPAAAWSFAQGDIVAGVGLLVLNFIMVGLVDDILRPYLIGKRSGVHPALILVGIVGGIPLFGLSGLVLGPLLMGLLAPLFEAWARPEANPAESRS